MSMIDASKIKLSQLRAFAAVAEAGGFGEAALQLDISQSAVSHAIASLESELGVVLFSRGRHGASLTFVGQQMLVNARQILQLLDGILEQARESRGAQTGQIRIATIRSLATHWLPAVLVAFNQQCPNVSVTVTKLFDHQAVQKSLANRDADIGLMDVYDTTGYDVVEIGRDSYVLLLPEETDVNQAFERYRLIMPAPNDGGYAELRQYVSRLDNPPAIAYEINEDAAIVSMVAQGLGTAILPYLAAFPIPDTVQVCALDQPLTRLLAAVIADDVLYPPVVFSFLDVVKQIGVELFERRFLFELNGQVDRRL